MTAPATIGAVSAGQPGGPAGPIGRRTQWQQLVRSFRADRFAMAGLAMVTLLTLVAVAAPLIARIAGHGPNQLFPAQLSSGLGLPTGPSGQFFFGVDSGRPGRVRPLPVRPANVTDRLAAGGGDRHRCRRQRRDGGRLLRRLDRHPDLPLARISSWRCRWCCSRSASRRSARSAPAAAWAAPCSRASASWSLILALFTWPYIARIVRGQTLVAPAAGVRRRGPRLRGPAREDHVPRDPAEPDRSGRSST